MRDFISVSMLRSWKACCLTRRIHDLEKKLGRKATDDDGLTIYEWALLERRQGFDSFSSTTASDLSWAMFNLDKARWMRAFAGALEIALEQKPDVSQYAFVLEALRTGRVSKEVRDKLTGDEIISFAVCCALSAVLKEDPVAAGAAMLWLQDVNPKGDARTDLLNCWALTV